MKTKKSIKLIGIIACVLSGILLVPLVACALTFSFNDVFSGDTPLGATPWLTANFEQNGTNTVRLTMSTAGLSSTEKLQKDGFHFNLDPSITDLSGLTASLVSGAAATFSKGVNAFKADGDGFFDILFGWDSGLGPNNTVVYDLTMTGLVVANFNFLSQDKYGNANGYHAAAHIQGIPLSGGTSGSSWVDPDGTTPVPEPTTLLLLGSGMVGLIFYRRKFKA